MKNEILQKTLPYFLKHGIRKMSNQKLVELLGISTKTIYKHFKNKEGLLEEVLYLHHAQQQETLKSFPTAHSVACVFFDMWLTGVEREYNVNNAFFQDLHYYYPELEKKIEAVAHKKYAQHISRLMKRGIEEGSFRSDIIPEVVFENINAQYMAITRSEQFKRFNLSAEKIMLNTITLTIRGICTVKGVEELDEHIRTRNFSLNGKKSGKNVLSMLNNK